MQYNEFCCFLRDTRIRLGNVPAGRKLYQSDVSLNMSKQQTVAGRRVIHLGS